MTEIRGEKIVFEKGDYHRLDAMPSVRHKRASVLALPRRPSWTRRCAVAIVALVMLVVIAGGSLFIALEQGYLDSTLTARAESAIGDGLGSEFKPKVGKVRLRFSENWMLALAAVDVRITHVKTGIVALKADTITAVLDPFALLAGHIVVARAEIGRAEGDLRFLPPQPPMDWNTLRIDGIPALLAQVYPGLDRVIDALHNARTEGISAKSVSLQLPQPSALGNTVELQDFDFSPRPGGVYGLAASIHYGKLEPKLDLTLQVANGKVQSLSADLTNIATEPLTLKYSQITGERREGLDLPLDLALRAQRDKRLGLTVTAGAGLFYADGDAQPVQAAKLVLDYDFAAKKIRLSDGLIDLGATRIPIVATVGDLDQVMSGKPPGFALEANIKDAVSDVPDAQESPELFSVTGRGFFLPQTNELTFDTLGILTSSGRLDASLHVQFAKPTPAVTFSGRSKLLSVASIKQLWPFWFAKKPRHWVIENMKDGTVSNAVIDVALAAGRIPEYPKPLIFTNNELHVAFDASDTSVRFVKTMPASSHTNGHFDISDRDVEVTIKSGQILLPSGKIVAGGDGVFAIKDTAIKPLMATMDLKVSGEAAALAEFVAFKPIDAMSRLPFAASDLTGKASADLNATFGLEKDQNPPPPDFNAAVALDDVGIKKPFQNHRIANLQGTLTVDPVAAVIKGKAEVDGMPFDLSLNEPIEKERAADRAWAIEGKLAEGALRKLSPSLSNYVSGGVGVRVEKGSGDTQKAKLDLTSASLSMPVIGWRKGAGIPATAEFTLSEREGQTDIKDLEFGGDGFGARGSLSFDKRGIIAAKFQHVKLATADDFALNLTRKSGGLAIEVSGETIDLRPLLEQVKSADAGSEPGDGGSKTSDTIVATIGRATGYNGESLSSTILKMSTSKGKVSSMNFSAVTKSQQAIVISRQDDPATVKITSGDAGALARFADFYKNMNGGLLNITLKSIGPASWRGSIDIHNFALINEERLKSIVSTPTGHDGRSLSDTVDNRIDTSTQKFRRGFARVMLDGKVVRVENGIVRGDQVGATFQGTVRDAGGRTDMTGTFMPAYGLNSLFGQVPIIGSILGNGRDRGLLGITFKLEGKFDKPKLSINPLSLIAPGVFRNIFEFE